MIAVEQLTKDYGAVRAVDDLSFTVPRGAVVGLETIHVAGAGIGGLATAVALQRHGVNVVVHDRAADLAPLGAGLSLWPNAVLALESLGVSGTRGGTIPPAGGGLSPPSDAAKGHAEASA